MVANRHHLRARILPPSLRFVLADDPGAGETIMAGLAERFGFRFDILPHALVESTQTGNPFREHNFLIARLDQLARKEDWQENDFVSVCGCHDSRGAYEEEGIGA